MTLAPGVITALEALQKLLRSWWTIVAGLCLGLAVGLLLWLQLPKTYEARATLFAAAPQIPQGIGIGSQAEAIATRLTAVRELFYSSSALTPVVRRMNNIPADMPIPQAVMDDVRRRTQFDVRIDERRGSGVMYVGFRDGDAVQSARWVNAMVDNFVSSTSTEGATDEAATAKALEGMAGDLWRQIQQRQNAITAFKSAHLGVLPENRSDTIRLLETRQRDLDNTDRDLVRAQENRDVLQAQAAMARRALASLGAAPAGETRRDRLARLRGELQALRDRYTEAHPAIRMKKVELQRALAASPPAGGDDEPDTATATAGTSADGPDEYTYRLRAADQEIQRLKGARESLSGNIGMLQARLSQGPEIDQQLAELTKGLDVLQERYKSYQDQIQSARSKQKLAVSRADLDGLQVLERAAAPLRPISPNEPLLLSICALAGLLLFAGPVLLRALFAPTILTRTGLKMISPVPVIASISQFGTPSGRRMHQRRALVNSLGTIVAVGTLVAMLLASWTAL